METVKITLKSWRQWVLKTTYNHLVLVRTYRVSQLEPFSATPMVESTSCSSRSLTSATETTFLDWKFGKFHRRNLSTSHRKGKKLTRRWTTKSEYLSDAAESSDSADACSEKKINKQDTSWWWKWTNVIEDKKWQCQKSVPSFDWLIDWKIDWLIDLVDQNNLLDSS